MGIYMCMYVHQKPINVNPRLQTSAAFRVLSRGLRSSSDKGGGEGFHLTGVSSIPV